MSKQKQKEPLSLMIVKTALAIAVFTGLGTIIIGGGVVIMKYYNNEVNNRIAEPVNQETENYYDVLEKKCAGDGCCLDSLRIMKENNYKEADKNGGCPEEYRVNGFRCVTSLQWCELIEKNSVETTEQELNIIGNYDNAITSMCSQNCSRYYIGSYSFELVDELENVDGVNKREIVFATGEMVEVEELPTIAGPDSRGQINLNKSEVVKFQIDNYQKIDFPKVSISKEELANYLENRDVKFTLKFVNPIDKELKFKIKFDDFEGQNDFQYFILKPNEIKSIQYIYKRDDSLRNKRQKDDTLDLVIINDFVDEENYRKYYWDEANSLDSSGTMIYVDKSINLEDCKENDTSDWQTYRNEEFGFEVKYPPYVRRIEKFGNVSLEENSGMQLLFSEFSFNNINSTYNCSLFIKDKNSTNAISTMNILKKYDWENYFVPKEINGLNGKIIQKDGYGTMNYYFIDTYFLGDNYLYNFQLSGEKYRKDTVDDFNQILSSFKFID